jgi:hypothetical protein
MLKMEYVGPLPKFSKAQENRIRQMVHQQIEQNGNSGSSASGRSVVYAVEYCEERGWPYTLIACPETGYFLKVDRK